MEIGDKYLCDVANDKTFYPVIGGFAYEKI